MPYCSRCTRGRRYSFQYYITLRTLSREGANVNDPDVMWDWITAYRTPLYDAFWYIRALKEYEFIYKKPFEQEICDILAQANLPPPSTGQLRPYVFSAMNQASVHFDQGLPNTATLAGACRMVRKSIARDCGIQLPITEYSQDEYDDK